MINTAFAGELPLNVSAESEAAIMTPDISMVILTWVTFLLLSVILYKFAWKPILKALDAREDLLRRSVESAERIKEELAQIQTTRHHLLKEAEQKAQGILGESREAAVQIADTIQHKAKEEAKIFMENARRDIREEVEKAKINLREESAQLAIDLAAKLIHKNLDSEENRRLIKEFIKE